jgi:methylated-DNA-[protein]-cysteine S-methyltransferase
MLNEASFETRIGKLYYIWLSESRGPEIVFLSNSIKSFDCYLKELIEKYPGLSSRTKKSDAIENSVVGYLSGDLKTLDLKPHFLTGTAFEKKIWKATYQIPFGHVLSYKEIAEKAGYPGAWRAAGTALNHNPVMIIVPCHRVIKSSGATGFFGAGEDIKAFLLELEQ